jgi:hypothetical protein
MMGYFSNLSIEIEEALCQGATVEQIAERFDVSVPEVLAVIEMIEESDHEPYAWD